MAELLHSDHCQFPEKFHPGKSLNFSKRTFRKKNEERSIRVEWYGMYPWLHYNIETDSVNTGTEWW